MKLKVSTKASTINRINDKLIDVFHNIDHLISVSVTLPYLPLVFRHLNSLP